MSRLLELRVRDFGLLRDCRLDLTGGFGVLSGETGAGKSLCVAALRWVLGGRIDGDAVRPGTAVSAVFEPDPACAGILSGLGIRVDDLVTLTREAVASSRSTCRASGSLVSQATLRDLGEQLADVTAQGASQRLLRRSWQRRALDEAGGEEVRRAAAEMAEAHRRWRAAAAAVEEARAASRRSASELAEARALIAELEPLRLREGEDAELAAERLRLRHAAGIARAASLIADAVAGEEGSAAEMVERGAAEVEALGGVHPELQALGGEARALAGGLRDLGLAARRLAIQVELDPARLEAVEERLDALARVRRRHGSIHDALAALDSARSTCDAAEAGRDPAALEAEAHHLYERAATAAHSLSAARRDAARRLEGAVEQRLAALELPHARFRVTMGTSADADGLDLGAGPVRCDGSGVDQVEFRLSSSRSGVPLPLDEGPSGGELSRVALALAAVSAGPTQPLLVLDEVDTGIGGETAARVGDLLAEIGRGRQVLAVTHRPEIAARAAWHLRVSRHEADVPAASTVERVGAQRRVAEVARMMSGRTTPAALARAAELLREGGGDDGLRCEAG